MGESRLAVAAAVVVVAVVVWSAPPVNAAAQGSTRRRQSPWGQQRSPSDGGADGGVVALVVPGADDPDAGSSYDVLPGRAGRCAFGGMQMFDGAVWSPKPCVTCVCKRGAVACDEVHCPRPHCQRAARTATTCCPVCQNTEPDAEPQPAPAETGDAAEEEKQKKRSRGTKKPRKKPDDDLVAGAKQRQQQEEREKQPEAAAEAPAPDPAGRAGRSENPEPAIDVAAPPPPTPAPRAPAEETPAPRAPAKADAAAERARRREQRRRDEEEKRQRYLEEELRLQEQEERTAATATVAPATAATAAAAPAGAAERAPARGDVPDPPTILVPPVVPPELRPPARPPARRPPALPALPRGFVVPGAEEPPGEGATPAGPAAPFEPELPRGCKSEDTTLTCAGVKLAYVPPVTDGQLLQLYLTGNAIAVIEAGTFRGLPRVEWIDLSRNRLTSHGLADGTFQNVTTLKRLFLDGNALVTIPSPLPPSLEELKINDNKLKVIDRYTFASLTRLLTLELEGNALSESTVDPLAFAPLARLTYMRLDRNQFRLIPPGLPPSLEELYLCDNQIEEISNGVFNKSASLSILHLKNNRLQETRIHPRALISLKNLESIDFSHNLFVHVPSFLPTALRHLVLTYNQLQRIPGYVFAHMSPGLEYLYLSFNRIVSDGVDAVSFHGTQSSLLELYLDHNLLQSVPLGLADLAALRTLLLNDNEIRTVPPQAFCVDSNPEDSALVTLRLDRNRIDRRAVPRAAFSCVRSLASVVLRPQKAPRRPAPPAPRRRPARPRARPQPDYEEYESHSGYEEEEEAEAARRHEDDYGHEGDDEEEDAAIWFLRLGLGLGLWQ